MNSAKKPTTLAFLGLALLSALSSTRPALADPISSSWSGASASVFFGNQSPSQQGTTAQASAGGTLTVTFETSVSTPYQGDVTGNVAASAGGDPAHLLQVTGSASAPEVGTVAHTWDGLTNGLGGASASWTDDAAIVTAPAGSSLPDMIRLHFTLTFSDDHGIGQNASLTASYNGTQLSYSGSDWQRAPYGSSNADMMGLHSDAGNAGAVDSSTITTTGNSTLPASDNWVTKITDTFHIDLPLNKVGVSNPFSLSLQLSPDIGLVSNSPLNSGLSANIALTSVTLPDGTPLSALGDSVSFQSGLNPTPAPEPASLLVWGLVGGTAGAMAVRRSRTGGKGR
jgi:hypothetical protein